MRKPHPLLTFVTTVTLNFVVGFYFCCLLMSPLSSCLASSRFSSLESDYSDSPSGYSAGLTTTALNIPVKAGDAVSAHSRALASANDNSVLRFSTYQSRFSTDLHHAPVPSSLYTFSAKNFGLQDFTAALQNEVVKYGVEAIPFKTDDYNRLVEASQRIPVADSKNYLAYLLLLPPFFESLLVHYLHFDKSVLDRLFSTEEPATSVLSSIVLSEAEQVITLQTSSLNSVFYSADKPLQPSVHKYSYLNVSRLMRLLGVGTTIEPSDYASQPWYDELGKELSVGFRVASKPKASAFPISLHAQYGGWFSAWGVLVLHTIDSVKLDVKYAQAPDAVSPAMAFRAICCTSREGVPIGSAYRRSAVVNSPNASDIDKYLAQLEIRKPELAAWKDIVPPPATGNPESSKAVSTLPGSKAPVWSVSNGNSVQSEETSGLSCDSLSVYSDVVPPDAASVFTALWQGEQSGRTLLRLVDMIHKAESFDEESSVHLPLRFLSQRPLAAALPAKQWSLLTSMVFFGGSKTQHDAYLQDRIRDEKNKAAIRLSLEIVSITSLVLVICLFVLMLGILTWICTKARAFEKFPVC